MTSEGTFNAKKIKAFCSNYYICVTYTEQELDATQQEKYEVNIAALKVELEKTKPSNSTVKRLMVSTFEGRRTWVKNDTPSVEDVLDVFPPLKESNRVILT